MYGLLLSSLRYYWRTNFAVLLGVAVATAVIAGALIVGDSVRDSLRQMSLDRLAGVDAAWVGHRFVRQELAAELQAKSKDLTVAPAIQMIAALTRTPREIRVDEVSVIEWRSEFELTADERPGPGGISLDRTLAERLRASIGDQITIAVASDEEGSTPAESPTKLMFEGAFTVSAVIGASPSPTGREHDESTTPALRAIVDAGSLEQPLGRQSATATITKIERLTRAGSVNVYGVESSLWKLMQADGLPLPLGSDLVLNRRTADQLGARVGDEVSLLIEIPASIPRDSLLGDRDETVTELVLTVSAIAGDASTPGRFGLNPSQQLPLNAFVPLDRLQEQLGLSEVKPTRRNPVAKPARVNAMFIGADSGNGTVLQLPIGEEQADELTEALDIRTQFSDLGLKLTPYDSHGYFALESDQMILENAIADAGRAAATELGLETSPVLVYLLNRMGVPLAEGEANEQGYSMYSVAAGIEFADSSPFGPFEFVAGGPPMGTGSATGPIPVVINDWLAADLGNSAGVPIAIDDTFPARYHVVGDRGELPEDERTFRVAGIVRLDGVADDRGFTPTVEGVTDVESYSDWREPFPLDHDAITKRDDAFWKAHRATPKVFLRLEDARELWKSRYGQSTSLRIAPRSGVELTEAMEQFSAELLRQLAPDQTGLIIQPVKAQGLQAAAGTQDFTGLFIGFSFFLIAAALLLIGLLFRLGVERRVRELGLLGAVGFSPPQVRRLMLAEGFVIACIGAAIGVPAAIGYAGLMIYGLKTWWNKAIGTQFLFLSVQPITVIYGVIGGVVVALAAVAWSVWQTRKISTRDLLHGATEPATTAASLARRGAIARRSAVVSLGLASLLFLASITGLVPGSEAFAGFSWQVVTFFLLGTALLVGTLALLAVWLASDRSTAVQGRGTAALARLSLRNAARNRGRSLLTASLIASAAFLIVAVATGKRNPQSESPQKETGNGGYLLVAESSQPILYDLNTPEGRKEVRLTAADPAEASLLDVLHIAQFRMRPGENASCLNLYQTQLPTILGVPHDVLTMFDREGRFRFADTPGDHPWLSLEADRDDGALPVIGDLNTLMYSLKRGIGGVLEVPEAALTDSGLDTASLEVTGMLDGSIFQGVLLMSEANFRRLFPGQVGFRYFLVEAPEVNRDAVTELLESKLADSGFDAEPVAARLADFLAVQNTYLSTFQTLGGLGLLLGTIGLATVMLRNVLERRNELALLRALGLQPGSIMQLIWWENLFLLTAGLAAGTVSALSAMRPHLSSTGADVPWLELARLLGAVLLIGMLAPLWAGREAAQTPILSSLRSE